MAKNIFSIFFTLLVVLLTSCDFHVVKRTGPQYSWFVDQAKQKKTFICEYRLSDSTIKGVKIESVFAEHKYFHDGGFFSKFDIDCCNSQLVVVSKDYLASYGTGYSVDWDIPQFEIYSSNIIYRDYKGTAVPDSILLKVIAKSDSRVIQSITLRKVVN